mmetsp:Transcript_74089/g.191101  ORF Transcript_74089/g.191101 Transcript_74089/m.191101 type:complete len:211 (-) Transcript_74089:393-1025(-)
MGQDSRRRCSVRPRRSQSQRHGGRGLASAHRQAPGRHDGALAAALSAIRHGDRHGGRPPWASSLDRRGLLLPLELPVHLRHSHHPARHVPEVVARRDRLALRRLRVHHKAPGDVAELVVNVGVALSSDLARGEDVLHVMLHPAGLGLGNDVGRLRCRSELDGALMERRAGGGQVRHPPRDRADAQPLAEGVGEVRAVEGQEVVGAARPLC